MWSINRYAYVLTDTVFYESLDHYRPDREPYVSVVQQLLPADWGLSRRGIWFQASPPSRDWPPQGWKIHLSATANNARDVLSAAVPVLVAGHCSFKFVADPTLLRMLVSKRWLRGAAGKFVTIYPRSPEHFVDLLEKLHSATRALSGPYILSDRRYSDSNCVFYRYGSFAKRATLQISGDQSPYMLAPDGQKVPDVRKPWCVLPDWVEDPVAQPPKREAAPPTLNGGRYLVNRALNFTNAGGVYLSTDTTTGMRVVIKEARPWVGVDETGSGAVDSLRREYRILKKIEAANIAPKAIELFESHGHCFLVEEYVADAMELRRHASANGFTRYTAPTEAHARESVATFSAVFSSLTDVVAVLHSHQIAFRDLSPNNVMILPDGSVKLVDFEAASEIGVDNPSPVFTPGFAAADQFAGEFARYESDYFALGALMLLYMAPVQTMIGLDSTALPRFASTVAADYGVPDSVRDLVLSLLSSQPKRRPEPAAVVSVLRAANPCGELRINEPSPLDEAEARTFVSRLTAAIIDSARYDRHDRVFPADPKVFVTNPLGLAYGAAGVAYALKKVSGEVPAPLLEWMARQDVNTSAYPPGLYVGMAGIAWSLLELGLQEPAEALLRESHDHPLRFDSADLFFGVSGWGIANLKMFLESGASLYAERAHEAGEWLLRNADEGDKGLSWRQPDSRHVGLGQGSTGVALFLLYLYLATRDSRFLHAGRRALDFDLSYAVPFCDGLSWPVRDIAGPTIVPYWRWGSAGIGTVVLRYLHVTKDETLRPYLDAIYRDVARKYAAFPGRFFGLAGLGEFLLDLADFEPDSDRYLDSARRVAAGIRLYEVNRADCRCGFPGFDLWKVSCDYGTGGAGIALFFHRLLTRGKSEFMLDELIAHGQLVDSRDGSANQRPYAVTVGQA